LANEVKFSFSVKSLLSQWGENKNWQLWGQFTQQSQWQIFNSSESRPFRDNNYEPSLYLNYAVKSCAATESCPNWHPRILGVGYVHQSNGQSLPLSRSWDRFYLQTGFSGKTAQYQWTAVTRLWSRIPEPSTIDDNPDIQKRIGHGEVNIIIANHQDQRVGIRLRSNLASPERGGLKGGSVQLEYFSTPLKPGSSLRWYGQLFHGYGESLLDFNHRQTTLGAGIVLTGWGILLH
jgi:phospholipase A1